jgi:hypothetical protein
MTATPTEHRSEQQISETGVADKTCLPVIKGKHVFCLTVLKCKHASICQLCLVWHNIWGCMFAQEHTSR